MLSAKEALDEARAALALPPAELAEVIGVSAEDMARMERGDPDARQAALRGAAEVFGLEVSELLREGVTGRASTTLLRSFVDHAHDTAFVEVVRRGVHRELGRFVRLLLRDTLLASEPDLAAARLVEELTEAGPADPA
jgi:transcriptional regulator with XRE-family HTH domain